MVIKLREQSSGNRADRRSGRTAMPDRIIVPGDSAGLDPRVELAGVIVSSDGIVPLADVRYGQEITVYSSPQGHDVITYKSPDGTVKKLVNDGNFDAITNEHISGTTLDGRQVTVISELPSSTQDRSRR